LIHYNTTDVICTYSGVTRLKGNLFTSELNTYPDVRAMVKWFSPLDNQYFPQLPNYYHYYRLNMRVYSYRLMKLFLMTLRIPI